MGTNIITNYDACRDILDDSGARAEGNKVLFTSICKDVDKTLEAAKCKGVSISIDEASFFQIAYINIMDNRHFYSTFTGESDDAYFDIYVNTYLYNGTTQEGVICFKTDKSTERTTVFRSTAPRWVSVAKEYYELMKADENPVAHDLLCATAKSAECPIRMLDWRVMVRIMRDNAKLMRLYEELGDVGHFKVYEEVNDRYTLSLCSPDANRFGTWVAEKNGTLVLAQAVTKKEAESDTYKVFKALVGIKQHRVVGRDTAASMEIWNPVYTTASVSEMKSRVMPIWDHVSASVPVICVPASDGGYCELRTDPEVSIKWHGKL